MEVNELLSVLKPLADAAALDVDVAARAADGNLRLLMSAVSEADARSRAAIGTVDFEHWSATAVACAQAIPPAQPT